jgi:serine/threonine protein kinase
LTLSLPYQHDVVRTNTCCPTFLLATAGPWFNILGAVFTDKWIVQRLTDFIWVGLDATLNEPHYNRVARIMYSLRRNVEKLGEYYVGLEIIPTGPNDLHPHYFPSIHAYRDEDDRVIEFKYIQPLEIESTCVTFLARTTTDTPKPVVVKFVHRYGVEAHRLLAKENLAPQLFYHGKVGVLEGDPSYGHLQMVVMEYIDGKTLDKAKRIPPTLTDRIRHALKVLHAQSYVFGDLRAPNVMITKNEEVKLIDFDWAGFDKKSRYPLLISPNLMWPAGVEALSIMRTWHDDEMLVRLLPVEE